MKINEIIQENKEDLTQLVLVKFSTSLQQLSEYFDKSVAYYASNKNSQVKVRLVHVLQKIQKEIEIILVDDMWQVNSDDPDVEETFNEFVTLNNAIEDYLVTL